MKEDIKVPLPVPNYLLSTLETKCARCRKGKMFKNGISISLKRNMEMPDNCPVCSQPLEIEVGFYYGTGYVSYALTVALSVAVFVAYWVLIGISINDNSLYYYLGVNIVVLILSMPYIMRLSRSLWLSFFVKYDPQWQVTDPEKPERNLEGQMKN